MEYSVKNCIGCVCNGLPGNVEIAEGDWWTGKEKASAEAEAEESQI